MPNDTPAHQPDAEWSLLACIVEDPKLLHSLDASLFYLEATQEIFRLLGTIKLQNQPQIMMEVSRKSPSLFQTLNEAWSTFTGVINFQYWKQITVECRAARALDRLHADIDLAKRNLLKGDGADLAGIVSQLSKIAQHSTDGSFETMRELTPQVLTDADTAMTDPESRFGIRIGYPSIDKITFGLHPQELTILAARPAVGKTTLATNIAANIAAAGVSVAFFSLEMPNKRVAERVIQSHSKASLYGMNQADANDLIANIKRIRDLPIIYDNSVSDLSDLISHIHQAVNQRQVRVVFVDYLQRIHIRTHRGNRTEMITKISIALKDTAMSLRVPIVCLAQLNRDIEKANRIPGLHDLRDSGSIEQDADCVILLHPDQAPDVDPIVPIRALVAKNRYGPNGTVPLELVRRQTRFREVGTM